MPPLSRSVFPVGRSAWPESGQAEVCQLAGGLPGGSGDAGGDDVGGMAVQ
jgi:hypothetical protein